MTDHGMNRKFEEYVNSWKWLPGVREQSVVLWCRVTPLFSSKFTHCLSLLLQENKTPPTREDPGLLCRCFCPPCAVYCAKQCAVSKYVFSEVQVLSPTFQPCANSPYCFLLPYLVPRYALCLLLGLLLYHDLLGNRTPTNVSTYPRNNGATIVRNKNLRGLWKASYLVEIEGVNFGLWHGWESNVCLLGWKIRLCWSQPRACHHLYNTPARPTLENHERNA